MFEQERQIASAIAQNIISGSRLAGIVLPLFEPEHNTITRKLAKEFTDIFLIELIQEGDAGIEFLHRLKPTERRTLYTVLFQGDAKELVYISPQKTFRISDLIR